MILSLDRQVTNVELSHELVEADVPMNTRFFWVFYLDGRIQVEPASIAKKQQRICSAYLSCELGYLLPKYVKTFWRPVDDQGSRQFCTYENEEQEIELITTTALTEADARGLMLLKILKTDIPKTEFWKDDED